VNERIILFSYTSNSHLLPPIQKLCLKKRKRKKKEKSLEENLEEEDKDIFEGG
jgi:hypothetical protein